MMRQALVLFAPVLASAVDSTLGGVELAAALHQKAVSGVEHLLYKAGPYYMGVAGMHQFAETWSRDLSHASVGLLTQPTWKVDGEVVPSTTIVRDIALAFLDRVTPDFQLVARVLDTPGNSWLGKEDALKMKVIQGTADLTLIYELSRNLTKRPEFPTYPFQAMYEGESGTNVTIDSNFMVLLGFSRYANNANASDLKATLAKASAGGQTVAEKLRLALGYYAEPKLWENLNDKPFIKQGDYQEWKDSVKQNGVSSFTNLGIIETLEALFFSNDVLAAAFEGAALYAPRFGVSTFTSNASATVKASILQWKKDILAEFRRSNGLLQECSSVPNISHVDGNLAWFRVATEPELVNALNFTEVAEHFVTRDSKGAITNLPGTANGEEYPTNEVAATKRVIGLAEYHGTMPWSWLIGNFAHAAHVHGLTGLRDEILGWLLAAQTKVTSSGFDQFISEIYRDNEIVKGVPYTSETPFMWGSNYVLQATSAILKDAAQAGVEPLQLWFV